MEFHNFLESTYVRTNIALQVAYSPYGQGKVQATQGLIHGQKRVLTWVNYVVILFQYLLVLCHIKTAPPTAKELVTQYKANSAIPQQPQGIDLGRQAAIQAHLDAQQEGAKQ